MAFDDLIVFKPGETTAKDPAGLIALGEFRFGVDTIPYASVQQRTSYVWAENALIGTAPSLQFTGTAAFTIVLEGTFYPQIRGGYTQMPALKAEAGKGQPLSMVDGRGNSLGQWVIVEIDENQKRHTGDGLPRRIDFTINLKKYAS